MSILRAIVLGIVQGLAEFLPISSSGHLILTRWLFGWDELSDDLERAFDVALHLGTLVGVIVYFRADLARLIVGGSRALRAPRLPDADGRMAWLLVATTIPAFIAGATLEDALSTDRIWLIAVMLIVFGLVLLWADRLTGRRQIESFRLRDALLMGVGQALALQPGVSRSGATMTMGRVLGFDRESAARIAFLMSPIVIAGAGSYKLLDTEVPSEFWPPFLVGAAVSAVTSWVAVWGTMKLVRTRSFGPFVAYRVVLGTSVLALLATGWR